MERLDKAALNALQPPEFRNENSLAATLKTLLFFTALMITVPIGLYFTTKAYIFEALRTKASLIDTLQLSSGRKKISPFRALQL
uniref:Isoform 2 of Vacuolar ATPase assembly integral membrane protein Vma21 n=1 Tax=Mus musculus TaxID=10090 RepID=Q78T54-2|nr:unnamed protein product [Mus musculus]